MPQTLIEFVMKKLCGFLLNKLQSAAKKTVKNPVRNIHAQRMREDSGFYYDWLLPKFKSIAAELGWEIPTISAFELTEAQQLEAARLREKKASRMHSFSQFEASKIRTDSEGDISSSRSAPATFRRNSSMGSESDVDDDSSDISSLSGTSSIWKNNPIVIYLREMEMKTQERKKQAVLESRQKAAARLQPKPLPQDKAERLKILKMQKARKMRDRTLSGASFDSSFGSVGASEGLTRVDEHESAADRTGRSQPYSPVSAALRNRGRWTRLLAVSVLVVLLFVLLHVDDMIPFFTFPFITELGTVAYMGVCGVIHFLLCDVELIYAFEAFELGMKSGEQVKTFYHGQVRIGVALVSATLVGFSLAKAWFLASIRTFLFLALRYYKSLGNDPGIDNLAETIASTIEVEGGVKNVTSDITAGEEEMIASSLPGLVLNACTTFFNFFYAVFDWQMNVFVRSNAVGRSMEHLASGILGLWTGLLGDTARGSGNFFHSMTECESIGECLSWRNDAITTLRVVLLYTAVFLLAVLAMIDIMAKSYRYDRPGVTCNEDKVPEAIHSKTVSPAAHRMPLEKRASSASSTDSGKVRRFRFRRGRKERLEEHQDSD